MLILIDTNMSVIYLSKCRYVGNKKEYFLLEFHFHCLCLIRIIKQDACRGHTLFHKLTITNQNVIDPALKHNHQCFGRGTDNE